MALIVHNVAQVEEAVRGLKRVPDQAHASAVNKTLSKARTAIRSQTAAATGLPAKQMGKRISKRNATAKRRTGILRIGTYPVQAIHMSPRQLKKGGVSINKPGGGKQKLPRGFINNVRTGWKPAVFERQSSDRLPIDPVTIDIVPHVRRVVRGVMPNLVEDYNRIVAHELQFRIRRKFAQNLGISE